MEVRKNFTYFLPFFHAESYQVRTYKVFFVKADMCLVPIKRVNADIATIYGGYMTLCWLVGVKRSRESQILYLRKALRRALLLKIRHLAYFRKFRFSKVYVFIPIKLVNIATVFGGDIILCWLVGEPDFILVIFLYRVFEH